MLSEVSFQLPKEEEMGATFEIDSFGGRHPVTKQSKLREGSNRRRATPDTDSHFDATFLDVPAFRMKRLLEADGWKFARGVPTDDKTSSQNYDTDSIIDGEHKTLTVLGKINEAMEDDDHKSHIYKHRLQLSDPKLSETRRNALLEHIADHIKKQGKKLKTIDAAKSGKDRPDIMKHSGYGHGVGMLAKAVKPRTMNVIPQDDQQSAERKRTGGVMSMESRMRRFDNALRTSRRRGL